MENKEWKKKIEWEKWRENERKDWQDRKNKNGWETDRKNIAFFTFKMYSMCFILVKKKVPLKLFDFTAKPLYCIHTTLKKVCLVFTLTQGKTESLFSTVFVSVHAVFACILLNVLFNSLNCIVNQRHSENKQIHQRCLAGSTVSSSSLCNVGSVTGSQLQGWSSHSSNVGLVNTDPIQWKGNRDDDCMTAWYLPGLLADCLGNKFPVWLVDQPAGYGKKYFNGVLLS